MLRPWLGGLHSVPLSHLASHLLPNGYSPSFSPTGPVPPFVQNLSLWNESMFLRLAVKVLAELPPPTQLAFPECTISCISPPSVFHVPVSLP